jgi:hypothetical protein
MYNSLVAAVVTNSDIVAPHAGLKGLLISFLIAVVVLLIVAGLIWLIENYVHPLPPPVKLVIAIILVICVIIWAISNFM